MFSDNIEIKIMDYEFKGNAIVISNVDYSLLNSYEILTCSSYDSRGVTNFFKQNNFKVTSAQDQSKEELMDLIRLKFINATNSDT